MVTVAASAPTTDKREESLFVEVEVRKKKKGKSIRRVGWEGQRTHGLLTTPVSPRRWRGTREGNRRCGCARALTMTGCACALAIHRQRVARALAIHHRQRRRWGSHRCCRWIRRRWRWRREAVGRRRLLGGGGRLGSWWCPCGGDVHRWQRAWSQNYGSATMSALKRKVRTYFS